MGLKIRPKIVLFRENSDSQKFWTTVPMSVKMSQTSPTYRRCLACDQVYIFFFSKLASLTHAQIFNKAIIFLKFTKHCYIKHTSNRCCQLIPFLSY